jgi:hypothetical protein
MELTKKMQCIHCHASVGHGQRAGMGGPLSVAEIEFDTPETP